jgi:signal transduction histidine kinase
MRRLNGEGRGPRGTGLIYELPRFEGEGRGRGPQGREREWLIVEVDANQLASFLDEQLNLLLRDIRGEYDLDIVDYAGSRLAYSSSPAHDHVTLDNADASNSILSLDLVGPPRRRFGGPPNDAGPDSMRFTLLARSRAGSLDALVARTRIRNLVVSGGVLIIIVITGFMLARVSRQSAQLAEAQLSFVTGVSHELRTPLTVIRTAAWNLRNGSFQDKPDRLNRYSQLIATEAERLEHLVSQVLQFASARAGRVIHERVPVSAVDLVEEELAARAARFEDAAFSVETLLPRDLPPISADRVALRHAIGNVLDNALKYGRSPIVVSVTAIGTGAIQISIADHGSGIPGDEQARIFEPFFRGSKALADQTHGTGLGLDLVRRIAVAHGGAARVESKPGHTRFTIEIPVAEPAESAA